MIPVGEIKIDGVGMNEGRDMKVQLLPGVNFTQKYLFEVTYSIVIRACEFAHLTRGDLEV